MVWGGMGWGGVSKLSGAVRGRRREEEVGRLVGFSLVWVGGWVAS